MNKMKIFTIPGTRSGFVLTLLITLLSMTAQTAWADDFIVTANGVEWTCTVIDGTTNVKIKPANRNDISGAVTIPGTVINLGDNYTVTEIESYAFDRCSGLTAITVPASVTKIGSGAFYQCSNLATYSGGDGVTVIEGDAFQHCGSLTSFTIPSGVTEIKPYTFKQSGLTSIAIPANVTIIDQYAFGKCGSLASVSIPASVTEIINNPFSGCVNLSSITVDEGNLNYKIVDGVLYSKDDKTLIAYPIPKSGTTYTIPASVTKIVGEAFSGCSSLTSVTIPASVTSIGNNAFEGCTGLTSVTIPAGVTKIERNAFQGCSGLTSVTIPAGVTKIEMFAFQGCSGLTSVTIPASVTTIEEDAFRGCTALTSVTIPASVRAIEDGAFWGCTALTSVTIFAPSLTNYGIIAFGDYAADRKIFVPSGSVDTYKTGWNDYATAIEPLDYIIDENKDVSILSNGTGKNVALKRAFPKGKKQTVCLPFAPEELLKYGKVWEFTGISDDNKAVMTQRESGLQANTPYIFEATNDLLNITYPSVGISIGSDPKTADADAGFTFHGTYEQKHWLATSDEVTQGKIYGFMAEDNDGQTTGQFVRARRETYLRPFSCYLEYNGELTGTQTATARRMTRGEGEMLPDVIDIVWLSAGIETTGISDASHLMDNG